MKQLLRSDTKAFIGAVAAGALLALLLSAAGAARSADPSTSPELVPFIGTYLVSATWGQPSGGYHAYPAIDITMPIGTDVFAAGAGTITVASRDNRRCNPYAHAGIFAIGVSWCIDHGFGDSGTQIRIKHPDGRTSLYLHLSKLAPGIKVGTSVRAGQKIGESGETGIGDGPHLHYEEDLPDGSSVGPDTWTACVNGRMVILNDLQHLVGKFVRNDSYGCLHLR